MNYAKMLDSEIENSDRFTKENFGLRVGDGFPEMVREIVKSEKLPPWLIIGLVMGGLCGKGIAESLKDSPSGEKADFGQVILNNVSVFDTPLAMLYWGIQIGRKLERESAAFIDAMEKSAE